MGVGWGFYLFGVGVPVKTLSRLTGRDDRMMERAFDKITKEREAGLRPPFRYGADRDPAPPDPVLDRVIRLLLKRRAAKSTRMRLRVVE